MGSMDQLLHIPDWIDWRTPDDGGQYTASTGYRKITNLLGGEPSNQSGPDVHWLTAFRTGQSTWDDYGYFYAPLYDKNPQRAWFFDINNKKLKYSMIDTRVNLDNTMSIANPVQNCKSSKSGYDNCSSDCCSTSAVKDAGGNCLYKWKGEIDNICSSKYVFYNDTKTCDRWSYIDKSTLINDGVYSLCQGQDLAGTFCLDTLGNGKAYMKSYLGCHCEGGCSNVHSSSCGRNSHGTVGWDDYDICYHTPDQAKQNRAEWQYIDDAATVACCSLSKSAMDTLEYPQCQFSFDPRGTNKCPGVMEDFCADHWGDTDEIGKTCTRFLNNSPANWTTTRVTVQNYITDDSRTPQDYISRSLAKGRNALSMKYYTEDHSCNIDNSPDDCDTNPNQPCCRDDSFDPFFMQSMPYMCNFYYGTDDTTKTLQGVCEDQLNYFCQEFSRDDLAADQTLQQLCGCFLLSTKGLASNTNITSAKHPQMDLDGTVQEDSPYYEQSVNNPGGAACDPICNTAKVTAVDLGGRCTQNICMIDNITITQVNSNPGDNNFTQNCGPDSTCYISNIDINEINSNTGALNLSQDCGTCYTFDDNDVDAATRVNCDTLDPYSPDDGHKDDGHKDDGTNWFMDNIYYIILFLLFFGVAAFFLFSMIKHHYDKKMALMRPPPESVVLTENYWTSAY